MMIKSIQVGLPQRFESDEPWETAIYKSPVEGPVFLHAHNLEGDAQADLRVHGGPDKAVNVYPQEHYRYWRQRSLPWFRRRVNLPTEVNGAFGENFTTQGLFENTVCIGDTFRIGEAIVQVSQPRQPCWKLARKWEQPKLPSIVVASGKTGWYFRVLQPGMVASNDAIEPINQSQPKWTVLRTHRLMYAEPQVWNHQRAELEELIECETLSKVWRDSFRERLRASNLSRGII